MRRGRSTQVSVFDPESSGNRFSAEFKLTGDGGSPYEFGIRFSVDGDYFALGGLSMGDMCVSTASSQGDPGGEACTGCISGSCCSARCSSP